MRGTTVKIIRRLN